MAFTDFEIAEHTLTLEEHFWGGSLAWVGKS